MKVVKTVKQFHNSSEILPLLSEFRSMANEAIRIGIEKNITSYFKLSNEMYPQLRNSLDSRYHLTAIKTASGMLKSYRRVKRKNPDVSKPYVKRLFVKVARGCTRIEENILRITVSKNHYVRIPLTKHTLESISGLRLGMVSLTERTLSIAISKEVQEITPNGHVGIDRNLENCTIALSNGSIQIFDTSKITRMKERYSEVRSHFKRNDHRIRKEIYSKYGRKQTEIENQELHKISKQIVEQAKNLNFGIVLENIKGIRKMYRKGNGQGNHSRRRMNSWSYFKLANMIEYKARWQGIPITYVSPYGTSSKCAICGSKIVECTERKVYCSSCKTQTDRDINAARNILARASKFKAIGLAGEAMNGNGTANPILLVDASQSRNG